MPLSLAAGLPSEQRKRAILIGILRVGGLSNDYDTQRDGGDQGTTIKHVCSKNYFDGNFVHSLQLWSIS